MFNKFYETWKERVFRNQSDVDSSIAYLSDLGQVV